MVKNSKKSRQQPKKPVDRHSQLLARPKQPTPKEHKTSSEHVDPGQGPTSLRSDLNKNLSAQTNGRVYTRDLADGAVLVERQPEEEPQLDHRIGEAQRSQARLTAAVGM
jgi:hypothetical protein